MNKILGIIPARSGSKGVPKKNIRFLAGKPLIQYTAEAALKSNGISSVILSTDSEEIASIGKQIGLSVPFLRPAELAADTTPTLPVIQHVISSLQNLGEYYDAVCLLQVTSPFRPDRFIDEAIEKFTMSGADSLISVLQVPHEFNPHWVFESKADGLLRIATGEQEIIKRRQDLPKSYYRDGSIYITKTEVIMEQNSLYGQRIAYIESNPEYYCNIDTLKDWEIAEQMVLKFPEFK